MVRVCGLLGAVAIAFSSILVRLSHASPETAAIFRCLFALPLLGLLAGHYRADREWSSGVLDDARARLARWRQACALPSGPDAADVLAHVRRYLADDLDTPKALAAVDGWATDAVEYGGRDIDAPARVRAVVDALLGVEL